MDTIIPPLVDFALACLRVCVCVLRWEEEGVSPDLLVFMQVSWSG